MKLIVSEGDFVLSEMSEHLTSLIMNTEAFIHQLSKIYKIVLFPFCGECQCRWYKSTQYLEVAWNLLLPQYLPTI